MGVAGTSTTAPPAPNAAPPPAAGLPKESRWYLLPSIVLLGVTFVIVYWGFSQNALPPGTDPAHWMSTAKSFVGLPYPGGDFTLQPFVYPPLVFPILGVFLLATGSPVTTGFVFGGFLLLLYGLSVLHLSRRYLLSGPFQFLFVGLALLNGTTLQILFWGGYPNFLALVFFNEALVFLLAFLRSRSTTDALLLYGFVALTFLTHDLTFAILAATIVVCAVFLLAQDRRWFALIVSGPNLLGMFLVGAVVAAYTGATSAAGLAHPGYLFGNPAVYRLDNLGELFHPLQYAPLYAPSAGGVAFDSNVMLVVLLGSALLLLLATTWVRRQHPTWVPPRMTIAVATLATACVVPALGYLAHVDTDYPRFVFFFSTPLALIAALVAERAVRPWIRAAPRAAAPSGPRTIWELDARSGGTMAAVSAILVALIVGVSIPTVAVSESTYAGAVHTSDFLSAMAWLNGNSTPGAILADSTDSQRWAQVLTDRNAFTPGNTYLDFYPSQILNDEESYLAWNTHYAASNNQVIVGLTGSPSSNQSGLTQWYQSPMYSAIVQGIILPILRIPTSSIIVRGTNAAGNPFGDADASNWAESPVLFSPTPYPTFTYGYDARDFWLNFTVVVGPGSGASISGVATPHPGESVTNVTFTVSQPRVTPMSRSVGPSGIQGGGQFQWEITTHLGQLPNPYTVTTSGQFLPTANRTGYQGAKAAPFGLNVSYFPPAPGALIRFEVQLDTNGTSNPAVSLPTYFDTNQFFESNDIRFLLLQNINATYGNTATTIPYFETEFGFQIAYQNTGWVVMFR